MHIRKYRVRKMSEGLERIKRELGPNAVILSTTRLVGQPKGETLEIAVATGSASPDLPAHAMAPTPAPAPVPPSSGGLQVATAAPVVMPPAATTPPAQRDGNVQALVEQIRELQSEVRHLRLNKELQPAPRVSRASFDRMMTRDARSAPSLGLAVAENLEDSTLARTISLLYETLRFNGVAEGDIELAIAGAWERHQESPRGAKHFVRVVEECLAARIRTSAPLWHQGGDRPQLAVFVGPTGVGKTTTIAKVAAHAKLVGHRKVGIVCADTFRIGGVYQLDSYAQLIGVPMHVASSLAELRAALHELRDCDLVLVDTAGRNPWSPIDDGSIRHEDYRRMEPQFDVQLHVCLAATTRTDDLIAIVERYRSIEPNGIVFTKADEAQGVGCMVSAAAAAEVPISHVCHGQGVPDDIACPTPNEVARWVRAGHPNGWSSTNRAR